MARLGDVARGKTPAPVALPDGIYAILNAKDGTLLLMVPKEFKGRVTTGTANPSKLDLLTLPEGKTAALYARHTKGIDGAGNVHQLCAANPEYAPLAVKKTPKPQPAVMH